MFTIKKMSMMQFTRPALLAGSLLLVALSIFTAYAGPLGTHIDARLGQFRQADDPDVVAVWQTLWWSVFGAWAFWLEACAMQFGAAARRCGERQRLSRATRCEQAYAMQRGDARIHLGKWVNLYSRPTLAAAVGENSAQATLSGASHTLHICGALNRRGAV